ncbi:MAG: PTS sugar transporter subunit IIC/EAL domain-containing protein, partial [Clostridia bacterium]|nr:PTS sugar transporter subunit IIC/EAL domain-containing protein [Clostridia bacterium]
SLISFFILSGAYLEGYGTDSMGPKSMFLAIITGLGASALYIKFNKFLRNKRHTLFSAGADREMNRMLSTLVPIALVALIFALINATVIHIFDVDSFRMLLIEALNRLFSHGGTNFFKGFFFVLLSSVLWFFGIHGSDTLEAVMQTYFTPGLLANQTAIANGGEAASILTKEFFDCFVLMGGCGSTICLLIAILIFSRNRARRSLGIAAAFPMIFNINEMMVFGLPIIFNPIMLIPFLAVPLVCYSVAYLAIFTGIVPMITSEVAWTTPIILGGYTATGSMAGAVLQVVNVLVGVLIYMPFVRLLDRRTEEEAKNSLSSFLEFFKSTKQELSSVKLTELTDANGDFAKNLCADLIHDIERNHIAIAYQPQYSYDGKCIGVEALLRWEHHLYGSIYPPLVIKLAYEAGILPTLEESVVKMVLDDIPNVKNRFGEDVKISFNITSVTIVTQRFLQFCRQINAKDPFKGKNLCIEITEQATLDFDESTHEAFSELHNMGLALAIDDFSMGQTSLNYLKDNMFDVIKLDGSLVKGLFTHQNCREIISSIVKLSSTLSLLVLAEFVETEKEREVLHEIGCDHYQGYLYSPAVFLSEQENKSERQ